MRTMPLREYTWGRVHRGSMTTSDVAGFQRLELEAWPQENDLLALLDGRKGRRLQA
jgi:hypothetical protein